VGCPGCQDAAARDLQRTAVAAARHRGRRAGPVGGLLRSRRALDAVQVRWWPATRVTREPGYRCDLTRSALMPPRPFGISAAQPHFVARSIPRSSGTRDVGVVSYGLADESSKRRRFVL
jgi:hypothetical protein